MAYATQEQLVREIKSMQEQLTDLANKIDRFTNQRITETQERLEEVESKVGELTYIEKAIGDGVIEIIKKEEMSAGDYTNPIRYIEGMSVEEGKWYFLDDKDLPKEAIKSGKPKNFDDGAFLE